MNLTKNINYWMLSFGIFLASCSFPQYSQNEVSPKVIDGNIVVANIQGHDFWIQEPMEDVIRDYIEIDSIDLLLSKEEIDERTSFDETLISGYHSGTTERTHPSVPRLEQLAFKYLYEPDPTANFLQCGNLLYKFTAYK